MELNRKFKQFMCRKKNAHYMEMYLHESWALPPRIRIKVH